MPAYASDFEMAKFEPFIFALFSSRNIDHVIFCQSSSLFWARKGRDGSKSESLLPRIQFLFKGDHLLNQDFLKRNGAP